MYCNKCGSKIPDNAAFCAECGAPLSQNAVPAPMSASAPQPASQSVPMFAPAFQPTPVPAPERGCFGSGWDDVKNSEGLLKRLALMALIDMVPIFNWVNIGYGWNWAKDLVKGSREGMSGSIVAEDNFKLGFFEVIITIILAFAMGFEGFLLGFVPLVGVLAAFALGVFADMFTNLSYMRVALSGRLGSAFEMEKLFDGFKRNLGTLFCVSFVPGLAIAGISLVIWLVFFLIMGPIVGTDLLSLVASSARYPQYGMSSSALAYSLGGSIVVLFVLGLIATYADMMAVRFCTLVKQRALAHFVARNIPEWATEADGFGVSASAVQPAPPVQVTAPFQPVSPTPPSQPIPPVSTLGSAAASAAGMNASAVTPGSTVVSTPTPSTPHAMSQPTLMATTTLSEIDQAPEPEPAVETAPEPEPVPEPEPEPEPTRTSNPAPTASFASSSPATIIELPNDQSRQPVVLRLTRANGDSCTPTVFPMVIGTDPHADWVIADNPKVSRFHVRISREGNTFFVEDLDSTNKTRIGMTELTSYTPTALSDGDELHLGYEEVLSVSIVGA